MSRKNEINRAYIEESVTDFSHPFRKGRASSQFEDDEPEEAEVATIRDVEAETPPHLWTKKRLERRLVEAVKVVQITVGRVGPAKARTFWPESFKLFQDAAGEVQRTYPPEQTKKPRLQATSAQIARSDEALAWPKRYVEDLFILRHLIAWLQLKAEPRMRFDDEVERWVRVTWAWSCVNERGWALSTADRNRTHAITLIIQGLQREGVPHR